MKELTDNQDFKFYSYTSLWYDDLFEDIREAKKYVFIESFRIANDLVGKQLCDVLLDAHAKGVKVKVLVDWWGTGLRNPYLNKLSESGVEIRYFKKIIISALLFTNNHCRDHRKIVAIDDKIAYIGSANITQYSTQWRESILRLQGNVATVFKKIFNDNFKIYNKDFSRPWIHKAFHRTILFDNLFFIREVPSVFSQRIKKNYLKLLKKAKESIIIETPYFLPGYRINKELFNAVKRGIDVTIIVPQNSDIKTIDLIRRDILKRLNKVGVKVLLYMHNNLHAKLLSIDNQTFSISSANIDQRSFRYMFEIALIGENPNINTLINAHITATKSMCQPFDKNSWRPNNLFQRILSLILLPFSNLF
ncbi:MAG: phosphatidylserine/phosphatidylglycerophosphate/cardiolipin synthase family protein [Bacteroidales bacterium]|jgi:cardiolipin synthase|nr:phosphatidylserine/phosphatidylglycerophosphate/cardiolipin synthase family protein [Bacteroidales bacterium]